MAQIYERPNYKLSRNDSDSPRSKHHRQRADNMLTIAYDDWRSYHRENMLR